MENIGNFYDDDRKGNTAQTNAPSDAKTKNPKTKISDSHKWASLIFTAVAILGWITIAVIVLDAIIFNSKLTEWIMIGK